ncbi:MAG: LuxR family transcriptional regulator [Gammaproteobacteria bacterium]
MLYWNRILHEVLNKETPKQDFIFTNFSKKKHRETPIRTIIRRVVRGRNLKKYYLGEKYKNVYLTRREAECTVWLVRGQPVKGIAKQLHLSPRTVEFYLKNVKAKLTCHSKSDLAILLQKCPLIQHEDFR